MKERGQVPKRRLRVAVIANGNPRNVSLWSGTPRHMLDALGRRVDLVFVAESIWPRWYRPLGRLLKLVSGMRFHYSWSPPYAGLAARQLIRRLRAARPDVVVAIAATDIAYLLPPDLLLVFVTDAVMPDLVRFYDMYRALPAAVQARAIAAEKLAFDRAILISVPSRWARQSAVALQQQDETKMAEIAWGANIPAIKRAPRTVGNGALRLLFVGSDWQRKGGPIALEVARLLNERGIDCWLDIVGCAADVIDEPVPNHVHFHNFLDKTRTADCAILDRLYRSATVFLLPTGAEAWGIVFAEAAHHGLPSVAYAVGGVTSVVKHGETGLLLPVDARAGDFAAAIERLTGDRKVYVAMSRAALGDARVRLNWEVWAERLEAEIRDRLCALPNRADASAAV